jgi:superoxide reductase
MIQKKRYGGNLMAFYKCDLCGNVVEAIPENVGHLVCCGQPMKELVANTTDAATEKHVPKITIKGSRVLVEVGEVAHPMIPEHFIQWIELVQSDKIHRVQLNPQCDPMATFVLDTTEDFVVYEYCNLHGLWKAEGKFEQE